MYHPCIYEEVSRIHVYYVLSEREREREREGGRRLVGV